MTGTEARRAWHGLVRRYGEPAPGPPELGLRLLPAAGDPRRAPLLRAITRSGSSSAGPTSPAASRRGPRGSRRSSTCRSPTRYARLRSRARASGRGPPPRSRVRALGDADAVSVGDFHLPHLVAYALAGEPRADDARMLELLEPFTRETGARRPAAGAQRPAGAERTARGSRLVGSRASEAAAPQRGGTAPPQRHRRPGPRDAHRGGEAAPRPRRVRLERGDELARRRRRPRRASPAAIASGAAAESRP